MEVDTGAAAGEQAAPLYEAFVAALRQEGCRVETGVFGAMMHIESVAAGPVNVIIDMIPDGAAANGSGRG